MSGMKEGTRVVSAAFKEQGQRGLLAGKQSDRLMGVRLHIRFDDGSSAWYTERDNVVFAEDSDEAKGILAKYAERLGKPDLDADVAHAGAVIAAKRGIEVRGAIDRLRRHDSPRAVTSLLELAEYELEGRLGKHPGWLPSAVLRLPTVPGDPIPPTIAKFHEWFADLTKRPYCGLVARVFAPDIDPRLLATIKELCAEARDAELMAVRILANDESAFGDLAQLRIVEREGELEFDVGDLTPAVASRVLSAAEGRGTVKQLNIVRQGSTAFNAVDLAAWLSWVELARFKHLNLSEAFRGKAGAEAVAKCDALAALAVLDVSACDIGQNGCKALGKAKNLASLQELRIDAGDYDRSKWTARALQALFPKKGGTLHKLACLHIRQWDVHAPDVVALKASGQAPALTTVHLSRETVNLSGPG